jgi:arylsulfatase A-like enzyme
MLDKSSAGVRRTVVISFDHWHLGYIGCYGNDWIETPNLDRLAAQAVVFDQHFAENIDAAAANHAWWTGRLQFPLDATAQRNCSSWCDELRGRGVTTHLLVESDGTEDVAIAPPFENIMTARGTDGFDVAETETPFAKTVQAAGRWLQAEGRHTNAALLWIKSRGVPSPWIPPQFFADLYLDEFGLAAQAEDDHEAEGKVDEPESDAPNGAEAQKEMVRSGVDDSLDWRYAAAMYAAYVTLVDRWLGKLFQFLDESAEWNQALLIVTAGAGQALGEHGRLADERVPLRAESVHAPLWIRVPHSDQHGTRRQAMVQTTDLGPTILDWFSASPEAQRSDLPVAPELGRSLLPVVRNEVESIREIAWMGAGRSEWGLRTVDFFYAEPGDEHSPDDAPPIALFEKPHDSWDQFNVASQFRQVSEDMHEMLLPVIVRT